MQKIIECIPNFSEGRDEKTIAKIRDSISKIKGAYVLDTHTDSDHNRSVITFAGEPKVVLEAAFQAVKQAAKLIKLSSHQGVHPRMGATDVLPLVPLKGVTSKECIVFAHKLAARIGKELKIPIYLYEKAATNHDRKNLSNIRNIGYEILKKEISKNPKLKPDYGPAKLGSAGATALGVREILVAYNVNLASNDLSIAKKIAHKIRERDGGFKAVKALGFRLKKRGIVQVSMNLTNYKITNPYTIFSAIKKLAKKYGVKILESEIIGLVPQKAFANCGKDYKKQLQLSPSFKETQILEVALKSAL